MLWQLMILSMKIQELGDCLKGVRTFTLCVPKRRSADVLLCMESISIGLYKGTDTETSASNEIQSGILHISTLRYLTERMRNRATDDMHQMRKYIAIMQH